MSEYDIRKTHYIEWGEIPVRDFNVKNWKYYHGIREDEIKINAKGLPLQKAAKEIPHRFLEYKDKNTKLLNPEKWDCNNAKQFCSHCVYIPSKCRIFNVYECKGHF